MNNLRLNPDDSSAQYLKCLNTCFGSWGDEELYSWVFERTAGSYEPDRLVIYQDDEMIAGSGISYRCLESDSGEVYDVGIMTGSWTLPQARGKGCFTQMIEASLDRCRELGCAALLAFVTHDNPSRRALENSGSILIPSRYVFTPDSWEPATNLLKVDEIERSQSESFWKGAEASRRGAFHFVYPHYKDFEGQFLDRPLSVAILSVGRALAIVEYAPDTLRLLKLTNEAEASERVVESLAYYASTLDKGFFMFETVHESASSLDDKEGFVTVLSTGETTFSVNVSDRWHIDAGDRM